MKHQTTPAAPNTLNPAGIHVLVVPYPAQGHHGPFMKFADRLVSHGAQATLITTEFVGAKIMNSVKMVDEDQPRVRIVTVPDGLEPGDERKDEGKIAENIHKLMPGHVNNLIHEQGSGKDKITCLIADSMFGWAMEIAEKNRIKLAMFWTSSPGTLASALSIPHLVDVGLIDNDGIVLKEDDIQILPDMPKMSTKEFSWYNTNKPDYTNDQHIQKIMFEYFSAVGRIVKKPKWLLCNWFSDLCPSAPEVTRNLLPVGPLISNGHNVGTTTPEDTTCLTWLSEQPNKSVIYIAFGSMSVLSQKQLDELAYGLELSGCRFLWVVRSGLIGDSSIKFPDKFVERVGESGKIVEWAPQEMVLAHPSVACFLTHCGWNSTVEGISMGVPLLCWPCFADQPYIRKCICDAWKIGLSFVKGENGIISRAEVNKKINELVSREDIRENSFKWKEDALRSISMGGTSAKSIEKFLEEIRT